MHKYIFNNLVNNLFQQYRFFASCSFKSLTFWIIQLKRNTIGINCGDENRVSGKVAWYESIEEQGLRLKFIGLLCRL